MAPQLHHHYNQRYFEDRDNLDLPLAETLKVFMHERALESVLDVGCGTGLLVKFLSTSGFRAVGCDIEDEAIKAAKNLNNIDLVKASAINLPFPNNSFDCITSISVVEHLRPQEVKKFIKESKRILKPGGFIFIVTPNFATPLRLLKGKQWFGYSDPTHINFYTRSSLARVLKNYGFTNLQTRFKTKADIPFNWNLPIFLKKFPKPIIHFMNYLLISSPVSNIRNSFWMAGQKSEKK